MGNTITDEKVIRGEMIVDEGDPLTNLKLEKSIAELKLEEYLKNRLHCKRWFRRKLKNYWYRSRRTINWRN